jgi:LmbE family N-acetylglucosaminyl deacetylase
MKFLFIFAHPDDETIGCGGTIKLLTDEGHQVLIVSVTDGGAGEVMPPAQQRFKELNNSVAALRKEEFAAVCAYLGAEGRVMEFPDGAINNQMVWGKLTETIRELIDEVKPDVLVTFDHTGWYFHLDHVAVSISTTLAFHWAAHQPAVFFHAPLKINGDDMKWQYVFPKDVFETHYVDVTHLKEMKHHALDLHASQETGNPEDWMRKRNPYYELYHLVSANEVGQKWLDQQDIFKSKTASA